VFLPNFNVTNGQRIYPAADLSEQISTAGKEASGTGNMKFSMNGALTIGTLDGANIEIREEVGAENFFLFGLTRGGARAARPRLPADGPTTTATRAARVIDLIRTASSRAATPRCSAPLIDGLLHHDPYMVLADFQAYIDCQQRVSAAYRDTERWTRMSILNTARSGQILLRPHHRRILRDIWQPRPTAADRPR
jgi:glycogen phosphorylase